MIKTPATELVLIAAMPNARGSSFNARIGIDIVLAQSFRRESTSLLESRAFPREQRRWRWSVTRGCRLSGLGSSSSSAGGSPLWDRHYPQRLSVRPLPQKPPSEGTPRPLCQLDIVDRGWSEWATASLQKPTVTSLIAGTEDWSVSAARLLHP
jgi:hypothetical protein